MQQFIELVLWAAGKGAAFQTRNWHRTPWGLRPVPLPFWGVWVSPVSGHFLQVPDDSVGNAPSQAVQPSANEQRAFVAQAQVLHGALCEEETYKSQLCSSWSLTNSHLVRRAASFSIPWCTCIKRRGWFSLCLWEVSVVFLKQCWCSGSDSWWTSSLHFL